MNTTQNNQIKELLAFAEANLSLKPTWLTRDQAAEILGIANATVDKYASVGKKIKGQYIRLNKTDKGRLSHIEVIKFKLRTSNN